MLLRAAYTHWTEGAGWLTMPASAVSHLFRTSLITAWSLADLAYADCFIKHQPL